MTQQYPRKVSLVVGNDTEQTDLSDLRIKFRVNQSDLQSPNNAVIEVYNLSPQTSQKIQKEYTQVSLQAGYESGSYGVVFGGTVRNYGRGQASINGALPLSPIRTQRESPTDTYLEINAGEGDSPYNYSTINQTLAAGYNDKSIYDALVKSTGTTSAPLPYQFGGNPSPRGKVLFGMSRDHARNLTIPNNQRWTFIDGKLQLISNTAYLEGTVVTLNSATGMVGMPQQTNEGVIVKCLLNPKIQIGTTIKINNADIVQTDFAPDYTAFNAPPPPSADGTYRVMVAEYEGDTRGDAWWTKMTCLSVDPSSPIQTSVQNFGAT